MDCYQFSGYFSCFINILSPILLMFDNSLSHEDSSNEETKQLGFLLQSWQCLISRLMSTKFQFDRNELHFYIKAFLNLCHEFEKKANIRQQKDFLWYTRGNFLSLLNIPEQIDNFGSLRWHWEGSRERFIQKVKPFMRNLRITDSFMKLQMKNIHHVNTLSNLFSLLDDVEDDNSNIKGKSHLFYRHYEEVNDNILTHNVIFSILLDIDGTHETCIICKNTDSIDLFSVYRIFFNDETDKDVCNQWHTSIFLNNDVYRTYSKKEILFDRNIDYLLFIPSFFFEDKYTVISKEWLFWHKDGMYALPTFSLEIYSSYINNRNI